MWAILVLGLLHLSTFFVTAMVCHGQLAADRPESGRLTEFYLWMSLGGVLGGLMNTLVAPLVSSSVVEYPLMLAAACALRPGAAMRGRGFPWREAALPIAILLGCGGLAWALRTDALLAAWKYADTPAVTLLVMAPAVTAAFLLRRRPLLFGLGVAVLAFSATGLTYAGFEGKVLHAERSFFGVLRVTSDPLLNSHSLLHGTTLHGMQSLDADEQSNPWGYYHREGPLGRIFEALQSNRPLREIGIIGLGAGATAAYGQPGQRITYYEIDPAVERIVRDPKYFTYLSRCRAQLDVVPGDGRLSLVHGPPRRFDLLVIDAFSSDSIPVHLMTREALRIYLDHLSEHGVLAIHISNRYLDLERPLDDLAKDAGAVALVCHDEEEAKGLGKSSSVWVAMARRTQDLQSLAADSRWVPLKPGGRRIWTDDYSNVIAAMVWRFPKEGWLPSSWWSGSKPEEHIRMGNAFASRGQFATAIANYQKALELKPDYAEAHYSLGKAFLALGQVDAAIECYQKALQFKPDDAGIHNSLGAVLADRGQLAAAAAHFGRALEINPKHAEAHYNLGRALLAGGQPDAAITEYQKVLEIIPNFAEVRNNLGIVLAARGRIDEAIVEYQKVLELRPDLVETHNNLGTALARRGRVAEAIAEYRAAIKIRPDDGRALGSLAWIRATHPDPKFRDGAEAVTLAESGVKLSPNDPAKLDALGAAYAEAKRFSEAVQMARKALALAKQMNQAALAESIQARLQLYEAGTPFREPPSLESHSP